MPNDKHDQMASEPATAMTYGMSAELRNSGLLKIIDTLSKMIATASFATYVTWAVAMRNIMINSKQRRVPTPSKSYKPALTKQNKGLKGVRVNPLMK